MRRHHFAFLIALIPFIAVVQPAWSQTAHETISVEVVDVPVYVISGGKPVLNLTEEDFTLLVNGKPQTIDYFDRIDLVAPVNPEAPLPAGSAHDSRDRRLFLLLFDLVNDRPAALSRARSAAMTMVNHSLPRDFFAVAINGATGAKWLIPFTSDRDVIRRAVLQLSPSKAHDALAISITDAERETAAAWSPQTGAGGGGPMGGEDPMPDIMSGFAAQEHQRTVNLIQSQMEEYGGLAQRFGQLEGLKHVVFFSEAFSADYIQDAALRRSYDAMVHAFEGAGILIDSVDLGVVGNDLVTLDMSAPTYSGPGTNAGSTTTQVKRLDETKDEMLFAIASDTGGQFIHWKNDLAGALTDLSNSVSAGYRLGFKPIHPQKGTNKIEVRVNNVPRGTVVSYRKGFSSSIERTDTGDALFLADIVQNDTPQTGTPPAFSFEEKDTITVLIPARQLAKEFGALNDVHLLLYVFDEKGNAVDYRERKVSVAATPTSDIGVRAHVKLKPGKYVAKALLRAGKSIGFARVAFAIPEPSAPRTNGE